MNIEEETERGKVTGKSVIYLLKKKGLEGVENYNIRVESIRCNDESIEIEVRGAWLYFLQKNKNEEKLKNMGLYPKREPEPELPLRGNLNNLPEEIFIE